MNSVKGRKWTIELMESDQAESRTAEGEEDDTAKDSLTPGKRQRNEGSDEGNVRKRRARSCSLSRDIRRETKQLRRHVTELTDKLRMYEEKMEYQQKELQCLEQKNDCLCQRVEQLSQRVEQLEKEKQCKEMMYRLKDFHTFSSLAAKINTGQMNRLQYGERLTLGAITSQRKKKKALLGVFECHNFDGHLSHVKVRDVNRIERLCEKHNIYEYCKVEGGTKQEIKDLLKVTRSAIPIVNRFLKKTRMNPKKKKVVSTKRPRN